MIPLKDIFPNPYQVRKKFSVDELQSLADSIKEVGVISPVVVRKSSSGYEIICGQRRLRASIIAGIEQIPAIVVNVGDLQCAQISIIENIHRENLGMFEEAEGYYNLMMFHKLKKEKLLNALSVTPFKINDKIKLLSLKSTVKSKIEKENIPEDSVKEILKLHSEKEQLMEIYRIKKTETKKEEKELKTESAKTLTGIKPKERRISQINRKNYKNKDSIYENTVKRTAELLKKNGAIVDFEKKEEHGFTEFIIKVYD